MAALTASAPLHKRLGDLPLVPGAYNFFQRILQEFLAEDLVGQKPLQPGILLLQFLQLLGLVEFHHPEPLPPVECLFADAFLAAQFKASWPIQLD